MNSRPLRQIRSYVQRDSRITSAQAQAIARYAGHYALPLDRSRSDSARQRRVLEIGFGNGESLLQMAAAVPAVEYWGVEVYRPGFGHCLDRVVKSGLGNVFVSSDDIVGLIDSFHPRIFDAIFIFFPDPWPKKRHHKRRLIQPGFLRAIARSIKRSGVLMIATDIEDYANHIMEAIDASPVWSRLAGSDRLAPRPTFRPFTKYERKALAANRRVFEFACSLAPSVNDD